MIFTVQVLLLLVMLAIFFWVPFGHPDLTRTRLVLEYWPWYVLATALGFGATELRSLEQWMARR